MGCMICGRDTYFDDEIGLDLCEGCNQPTDACTCEDEE